MPSGESKKRKAKAIQTVAEPRLGWSWPPIQRAVVQEAQGRLSAALAKLALGGVLLIGMLALPVAILLELRERGRNEVNPSAPYRLDFHRIQCDTPPAQERAAFLEQVRQLAGMSEQGSLLEEGLASRLADAFGKHPWVKQVHRVTIAPSRGVCVELEYRTPVLEVLLAERIDKKGVKRPREDQTAWIVDADAFVLPRGSYQGALPVLFVPTSPPRESGEVWDDLGITTAAKVAGVLMGYPELNLKVLELTGREVVCATPAGTRVLWGHAPGSEAEGEAKDGVKLERLREYRTTHGSLDKPEGRYEHDARPMARCISRPLPH